jgi:hypothetical protein
MSDAPPIPEAAMPEAPAYEAWAEGVLQRQSAMLEQLGEAALRMALAIERRLSEAPADAPCDPAEAAMAFSRVARVVRLTAMLQSKLVQELAPLKAGVARAAEKAKDRLDPAYNHKARVEAIIQRAARARRLDDDEIDRLGRETAERLDDDDVFGDVLTRPVGELVSLICRDLGFDPDWTRLAEEAWAQAEAAAGDPRSPFVLPAFPPRAPPPAEGEMGTLEAAPRRGGIPPPAPFEPRAEPVEAPAQARERAEAPTDWTGV